MIIKIYISILEIQLMVKKTYRKSYHLKGLHYKKHGP